MVSVIIPVNGFCEVIEGIAKADVFSFMAKAACVVGTKADGELLDNCCGIVVGVKKNGALFEMGVIIFVVLEGEGFANPKFKGLIGCI